MGQMRDSDMKCKERFSISKRENWTLSKTEDRADVLIELQKWIEEKGFEVQKYPSLRDLLS